MAKIKEITDQTAWDAWVASRPTVVQELCALLPPDRLYSMKSTGRRVMIVSYHEDRTVTVAVTGKYNALTFERQVFGIKPEDLEECDLPGEDEILGVTLTEREDARLISAAPDLLAALEELMYARTDKAEKMARDAIFKAVDAA